MPPNRTSTGRPRGRPPKGATAAATTTTKASSTGRARAASNKAAAGSSSRGKRATVTDDPFESDPAGAEDDDADEGADEEDDDRGGEAEVEDGDEEEERESRIPGELLTRLLHEFFEKDGTRIGRDANEAVRKYIDVFVREAIARVAAEATGGFFDVADLEKITPQLLLDL